MVNELWQQEGIYALANFQPAGYLSDHSPCIVSLFQQGEGRGKHFKFFNMWMDHSDFQSVVSSSWNQPIHGTKQYNLCKTLQRLKENLKQLNYKLFTHISAHADKARHDLKAAQMELHDLPTNIELQSKVALLRKQAVGLYDAERSFYYQHAKCAYLSKNDKCTKFFHSLVKRNVKKNFIAAETNHACDPIDLNILREGPSLSPEQANSLIKDISPQEIKEALSNIGDEKSPGPDGYSSCFFKKAWETIEGDFVNAIIEFFDTGSLLRLAPILGSIIDNAQAAFVKERSLVENVHLTLEPLKQYNRKRVSPRCLLKIDLRKAYDSIY
ncbi:uncharacterized protein LOC111411107 [Olea europaea var. sylvestris]|uniref:uncharacterized protein LOC111411107 n=1 Tax=Olea europaea var. sylvestris TaxID=158386 RepID=UPI000C1D5D57|nr:uncharacterized protein LOC111411107 [Olea europaea var. sylvestris]